MSGARRADDAPAKTAVGRRWLVGAALVVAAALLSAITPSDDEITGPFLARGSEGEQTTARTLSAQVLSVTFADQVVSERGYESDGNWLVVELAASAPRTEEEAEMALAALHVDGLVFHASEQMRGSLRGARLHVGTDTVGVLAFELADEVRAGDAELWLTSEGRTPRLDDVLVLPLSLDDAPRVDSVEITKPEIADPAGGDADGDDTEDSP